jgi:hypothetical protein
MLRFACLSVWISLLVYGELLSEQPSLEVSLRGEKADHSNSNNSKTNQIFKYSKNRTGKKTIIPIKGGR